ncbi:hypothetical protein QVD17_31443 [Tagetes erecta]|uniref:Uncharacterized protein n=1 Tax=Tagetes erecta TaxID=13708 RepID=A0AAD8K5L1_TARER|nr:hypothetical protein QVD17_31443 [Tagetes erecta]
MILKYFQHQKMVQCDVDNGKTEAYVRKDSDRNPSLALAVTSDGGFHRRIHLWDTRTHQLIQILHNHIVWSSK